MKKVTLWSVVVLLVLAAYFIFTLFFTWLFQETPQQQTVIATATPIPPTFTPTSTATPLIIADAAAATPTHTATLLATPTPSATPSPAPTNTPLPTLTPVIPQAVSDTAVNVRTGPGTNYPVIGTLLPNNPAKITGRNDQASWWQVQLSDGTTGWVFGSVVAVTNGDVVPIEPTPTPPVPTATPVPPTPTRPLFQYEPTGWWGDTNFGLTRIMGTITDVEGNPVNGVYVEAQCGTFRIISNPSGPVAGSLSNDSVDDPPGFYDITLDRRPIPCKWFLTVASSEDGGRTVSGYLSDHIEVETTIDKSIIVANWRKNW